MSALPQPEVRRIADEEFQAHCLELIEEVRQHGLTLVITHGGEPVAELRAPDVEHKPFRSIVGRSPNIEILGDIISPLPQEWTLPEWAWEKDE